MGWAQPLLPPLPALWGEAVGHCCPIGPRAAAHPFPSVAAVPLTLRS